MLEVRFKREFFHQAIMERRSFLERATYAVWALIGGALAVPAFRYLFSFAPTQNQGEWIEVGSTAELPVGTPKEMSYERVRGDAWRAVKEKATVWVVKNGQGVTVFAPGCTHLGCAFHYEEGKKQFLCPCHDSWFSLEGQVLTGPAPRPLDRHRSRLQDDKLFIGPVIKA
jgi:menaquinol-cytochrome c reductase iron-sulfur subunit